MIQENDFLDEARLLEGDAALRSALADDAGVAMPSNFAYTTMLAVTACERQREKRRRVVAVVSMVAVCLLGLVATVYFVGQHIADFIMNMTRDISVTKHDVPQIVCVAVCFVFLASLNMLLRKKFY